MYRYNTIRFFVHSNDHEGHLHVEQGGSEIKVTFEEGGDLGYEIRRGNMFRGEKLKYIQTVIIGKKKEIIQKIKSVVAGKKVFQKEISEKEYRQIQKSIKVESQKEVDWVHVRRYR